MTMTELIEKDVRKRLIDAVAPASPRELDGNLSILGHIALKCERPECNP
jgi:hypothetical protein